MPGVYTRFRTEAEAQALREEASRDRRPTQDEAAILIAEALRARREAERLTPSREPVGAR